MATAKPKITMSIIGSLQDTSKDRKEDFSPVKPQEETKKLDGEGCPTSKTETISAPCISASESPQESSLG
jgi:hypothetical protein